MSKTITYTEDTELMGMIPWRKKPVMIFAKQIDFPFAVKTKEGTMRGKAGDFLIRGVEGELYPCDAGIFKKTYDAC